MAKRDPNVTARNKAIAQITEEMKPLQSACFKETKRTNEVSLNAFIGSKADEFIDLKHEVITTPEDYVHKWIAGMEKRAKSAPVEIQTLLQNKRNKNLKNMSSFSAKKLPEALQRALQEAS